VEASKRELEARVVERTGRLSAMTERALAADAAKTRFMATVSHEVRTPLNGVIGMASVVLAGDLDERTRRNVTMIRTSGLHLLDVINRILDFSKLENSEALDATVAFDLRELIDEVMAEARFSPHSEGLDLAVDFDTKVNPGRIGHRQGLRQILTNLVGNATKFTDAGSVRVSIRSPGRESLRIEVRDTGLGIADEQKARIFLPFEQADGSMTRRHGGTGLGLAICAEMVKRMGGRIGVESAPGKGSRFWVELDLPVAAPEAVAQAEAAAAGATT
jgi:signal transduction histidine kinase